MILPETCPCGKRMHMSPTQTLLFATLIHEYGEYKEVKILGGDMYKVPLWYLIMHPFDLTAEKLPTLGFEKLAS